MPQNTAKITILGATFSMLAALMSFPLVALANNWASPERRGSCFIPRAERSFECKLGPYNTVSGAKQIGGFMSMQSRRLATRALCRFGTG